MKEYKEVPNIITSKDLDYLTDLFNWNFNAYKTSINMGECIKNNEFKKVIDDSSKIFCDAMNDVISILEGGIDE